MEKTPTSLAPNEISDEIASVSFASVVSWTRVGALLDRVDREEYWRSESSSFTEWVKSFAAKLGLKDGSVWRMLTASRFYIKLQADLLSRGVSAPKLNDLDESVSAEKLELLAKIRRVAGTDVTDPIALQVIDGTATRTTLRSTWLAYRPILGGRTARGRGQDIPTIDPSDRRQFVQRIEAEVMTALQASGPQWTGCLNPVLYRLFTQVQPQCNIDECVHIVFDIVAVVRELPKSPLVFHAIDIQGDHVSSFTYKRTESFRSIAEPFCDVLWTATNNFGGVEIFGDGNILTVMGSSVEVRRSTKQSAQAGSRTGDLAKGLLLKVIKT